MFRFWFWFCTGAAACDLNLGVVNCLQMAAWFCCGSFPDPFIKMPGVSESMARIILTPPSADVSPAPRWFPLHQRLWNCRIGRAAIRPIITSACRILSSGWSSPAAPHRPHRAPQPRLMNFLSYSLRNVNTQSGCN